MFQNNSLTKNLGIKYPIFQAGINHLSRAELAGAISEIGGLGIIGAGLMPPQWLEKEIVKVKKLTKNPFGVTLFLRNPKIEELVKTVIFHGVPVVFTYGGNPLPYFFNFQAAGTKIVPIVPSSRLAKKMEDNDADAVSVQGFEGYGFVNTKETTFSLIPQTKKNLKKIPLIAFGGIYDGMTAKAAFILGADGIQMETRFLTSKEALISEAYKKKIVETTVDDIDVVLGFTGYPLRVIKNQWSERIKRLEEKGAFPEEIKIEGVTQALDNQDIENMPLLAGLSATGISEIKSCSEIIEEIVKELKDEPR